LHWAQPATSTLVESTNANESETEDRGVDVGCEEENMKSTSVVGVILIVLGILVLAYQGITYISRKKVIDIGPIQATTKTDKTIPLPPVVGGIALVAESRWSLWALRRQLSKGENNHELGSSRRQMETTEGIGQAEMGKAYR
jgi:hypothetical protein